VLDRDDAGRPVARRLERAVLAPPRPRHVPHFGCVLGPCCAGAYIGLQMDQCLLDCNSANVRHTLQRTKY